jgi:hypothetical protein
MTWQITLLALSQRNKKLVFIEKPVHDYLWQQINQTWKQLKFPSVDEWLNKP